MQGSLLLAFFLGVIFLCSAVDYEILPYNPVADPKTIVVSGSARFTVLTPNLIRLEYTTGKFEDRATPAVVNRFLPVPQYSTKTDGGVLIISTSSLVLSYRIGSKFTDANALTILSNNINPSFQWKYGQADPANLLGTIRSLDLVDAQTLNCDLNKNVKVHDEYLHCEWGLISRSGWAVYDDSTNWGLGKDFFWDSPNTNAIDLYFFGHGHNYKQALKDYIAIGGKIALVPRQASGIWWSRWYNLNNLDVTQVVEDYLTRFLPLDVYILDMDWHAKFAWGGYTLDPNLFPYAKDVFNFLHDKGLIVGANIHDSNGVHPWETMYKQMCQAIGINPNTNAVIPFSCTNSTYLYALDDIVLGDVETQGMDFWWIDWQQGGTAGGCLGQKQNPTWGLNHIRGTDQVRRGSNKRGLILARFGGLGSHRYQVGFSGDVNSISWSNLAYQPYFSFTASNVAYGFWSHDLVGPPTDHELHTRWIQWGAYSGIFRTHDRGLALGGCADTPDGCPRIEVWNVPDIFFTANREAMLERSSLIPYIYTASRVAFDSGVSILRPMYYEYPELNQAYAGDASGKFGQYFFGDDIFVAPVTVPGATDTSLATTTIWVPPGKWYEKETGVILTGDNSGNTFQTKAWDLSEIPVFIRAGAVIPRIPVKVGDTIALAARQYTSLVLAIYPGAPSGSTQIYEDDGLTTNYLSNQYSWINVQYERTATSLQVTISSVGTYAERPKTRKYYIEIVSGLPITSGTVGSAQITYSKNGGANTWLYDGKRATTIIETDFLPTINSVSITVQHPPIDDNLMSGIKGALSKGTLAKRILDKDGSTPGTSSVVNSFISQVSSAAMSLSYLANDFNSFNTLLKSIPQLFLSAIAEIEALNPIPPAPPGSLLQLWDQDRNDNCLCGTADCITANNYYGFMRIEGYQPKQGTPGTIPLHDYWNEEITDNYATPQNNTPTGYVKGNFESGIIFKEKQPNTVPLVLYWSAQRNDMLTVASIDGLKYAKNNGYTLVTSVLGYVYSTPPEPVQLSYDRWAHAIQILYNTMK